jgi:hypothetical protein
VCITEVTTYSISHTRIEQMKCSENLTLLQIEFQIILQSFKRKKDKQRRVEEALHSMVQEQHLALEMSCSHQKGDRENTCKITRRQSLSN